MFFITCLFAFIDGFTHITLSGLGILGIIVLLSMLIDTLAGIVGAKYSGASKKSLIYGFIGVIVGTALFFPFGGILGLFGGVLLGELLQQRSSRVALKSATGSVIGTFAGMVINCLLAITFLILFLIFVL